MKNKSVTKLRPLREVIVQDEGRPLLISHRGEWSQAPENSIEAMLLAIDGGADMVELDVQCTTSGTLYLMHDDTTDRMTNRVGLTTTVRDDEFDELLLREADGGADAKLTEHQVPTLRMMLEAARGRVHLNIDTKHRRDLEAVGDLVREMGLADQVLIKMEIDPVNPDLSIKDASWFGQLTFMPVILYPREKSMVQDALKVTKLFNASMLEISFNSLPELIALSAVMQKQQVRLWCNTLNPVHPLHYSDHQALQNPDSIWGELIRHGVGALQTDHVRALDNYLREFNKASRQ